MSLITLGAGLLADGVRSLFSDEAKERRATRREERKDKRAADAGDAIKTVAGAAGDVAGSYTKGAAAGGSDTFAGSGGTTSDTTKGDFLKKNWIWLALAAVVLFGGNLMKPKRTYRRRTVSRAPVRRYKRRKR